MKKIIIIKEEVKGCFFIKTTKVKVVFGEQKMSVIEQKRRHKFLSTVDECTLDTPNGRMRIVALNNNHTLRKTTRYSSAKETNMSFSSERHLQKKRHVNPVPEFANLKPP